MASRPEIYRSRAGECDATAASATDSRIRMNFMELATQWRDLARQIETLEPEEPPHP